MTTEVGSSTVRSSVLRRSDDERSCGGRTPRVNRADSAPSQEQDRGSFLGEELLSPLVPLHHRSLRDFRFFTEFFYVSRSDPRTVPRLPPRSSTVGLGGRRRSLGTVGRRGPSLFMCTSLSVHINLRTLYSFTINSDYKRSTGRGYRCDFDTDRGRGWLSVPFAVGTSYVLKEGYKFHFSSGHESYSTGSPLMKHGTKKTLLSFLCRKKHSKRKYKNHTQSDKSLTYPTYTKSRNV